MLKANLEGPPQSWSRQLEAHYAKAPSFQALSLEICRTDARKQRREQRQPGEVEVDLAALVLGAQVRGCAEVREAAMQVGIDRLRRGGLACPDGDGCAAELRGPSGVSRRNEGCRARPSETSRRALR